MDDLRELAKLIKQKNEIDERISEIINTRVSEGCSHIIKSVNTINSS